MENAFEILCLEFELPESEANRMTSWNFFLSD